MKKIIFATVLALGLAFAAKVPVCAAQEKDEDKFSFGKVVSVSGQEIKVKEYDFAKDADVEMTYAVTTETELGNINAVTDLKASDDVVIDYTEKDGKRVVTTLVKEDKGAETAPEGTPAEAAPAAAAAPAVEQAPAAAAAPVADAPAAPAATDAVPAAAEQK